MRSGTSFFDLTVYRKTFTRFWPLWVVNLVIWLFILPFNGLMQLGDDPYGSSRSIERFARNVGDLATEFGLIFALAAGLVVAMAVCSHLYNNRSANFMGALPVRREGLFISTYLAGLTMLIGPNVVIFLLTLLVETVGGAVMWLPLLYWLAALCAMEFFFYSFAVCLGQFAGHVLALPVFYAVFNAIVAAAYALLNWVMRAYYFGFYGMDVSTGGLIYWCTPVMAMLEMDIDVMQENNVWIIDIEGLWIAGVYAVVAVVLTACALLLYRRRHLESAGDIVAVKAMRPVFKYGVSACVGLFFGMLMHEMFGFTQLGLMIAVILWGIVGYFVAQMLLDKTIRVFKKWKGAAGVTAAFLILFAVIGFDLTGYETRVPSANEVESVQIVGLYGYPSDSGSHLNITLEDPESVADVVALHEAIVKYGENGAPDENGSYGEDWGSVSFTYLLKSGRLISRKYTVNFGEELGALGQKLRDNEEVRYKTYELDVVEYWKQQGAQLEVVTIHNGPEDYEIWGSEAETVWNAVMADFEAGNIGVHVLQSEEEFHDKILVLENGGEEYACSLEFRWASAKSPEEVSDQPADAPIGYNPYNRYWYMQIVVLEQSAQTREVLEGLLTPDNRYQDNPDDNPLWRSEG